MFWSVSFYRLLADLKGGTSTAQDLAGANATDMNRSSDQSAEAEAETNLAHYSFPITISASTIC
jgi:hypothetical protein